MKKIFILIAVILSLPSASAISYVLPEYKISSAEMQMPAEEVLRKYDLELGNIYGSTRISKLREHRRDKKVRLTAPEKEAAGRYRQLEVPIRFWKYIVDLKEKLIALPGTSDLEKSRREADLMAKMIVQEIYDISQRYQINFTALFRNYQINRKTSERGFCYHYVSDILRVLMSQNWKYFDLHWGEAYAKTFRENNALVITVAGAPFETGLAIDVWRTGGRPFWRSVKGDRFPWQEAPLAIYE
jgi:hypothetical protein